MYVQVKRLIPLAEICTQISNGCRIQSNCGFGFQYNAEYTHTQASTANEIEIEMITWREREKERERKALTEMEKCTIMLWIFCIVEWKLADDTHPAGN